MVGSTYKLYSLPLASGLWSEGIKIGGLWLRIFQDNASSRNLRLISTAWTIFYRLFQCQTLSNGNINILCIHSFTYSLNKYLLGGSYVPVLIKDSCYKHFIQGISLNTHQNVEFGARAERRCQVPPTEGVPSSSVQPSTKASRLPRSLPSAPPPAVSRDVAVEPELAGLSRAKFVAGGRCRCNHKG